MKYCRYCGKELADVDCKCQSSLIAREKDIAYCPTAELMEEIKRRRDCVHCKHFCDKNRATCDGCLWLDFLPDNFEAKVKL